MMFVQMPGTAMVDRRHLDSVLTWPGGKRERCTVLDRSTIPGYVQALVEPEPGAKVADEGRLIHVPEYLVAFKGMTWDGEMEVENLCEPLSGRTRTQP